MFVLLASTVLLTLGEPSPTTGAHGPGSNRPKHCLPCFHATKRETAKLQTYHHRILQQSTPCLLGTSGGFKASRTCAHSSIKDNFRSSVTSFNTDKVPRNFHHVLSPAGPECVGHNLHSSHENSDNTSSSYLLHPTEKKRLQLAP